MTDPSSPRSKSSAPLLAGAGRAQINYPGAVWPLDGFAGQHDPLRVRVLVLHGPTRLVWAVLDQTALPPEPLEAVRERVQHICGGDADVLISVSHTFSAPHLQALDGLGEEERERMRLARASVFTAIDSAVGDALSGLRPAKVQVGTTQCDVNVNRDVDTAPGWTLGVNEFGFSDKEMLTVLVSDESDDGPIAALVSYGVQPSVMHESSTDSGRLVTADLAGAAMDYIERALPGCTSLFLIGAAGDQSPALTAVETEPGSLLPVRRDAGEAAFIVVDLLGRRLGRAAVQALRTAASDGLRSTSVSVRARELRVAGQQPTPRDRIRPVREHRFEPTEERLLPYWVIQVGEATIIGTQVELSAITGRHIRSASSSPITTVATMVNGGAKYLPEVGAFDRITYEAQSSQYARGAAEQLAAAALSTLSSSSEAMDAVENWGQE